MPKAKSIPCGSIGKCIYCGAKDCALTEEHILAANLGGEHTLLKACCKVCQTEINHNVEAPCMQKMFRDIRYKLGIGSRRLNERPAGLKASIREDGNYAASDLPKADAPIWNDVLLPYDDHPSPLILPCFKPPGIMMQWTPEASSEKLDTHVWFLLNPTEFVRCDPKRTVRVKASFNNQTFRRLLAKTAHCAAVATFGIEGFDPCLSDIILGKDFSFTNYYVGMHPDIEPPNDNSTIVKTGFIVGSTLNAHIHVNIRLFANLGTPTYTVIAGKKI